MDVLCNLTAEQAALYQAVVDDMMHRIESADGIERRGLVLATMTKLKQVCNHPAQFLRDGSALAGPVRASCSGSTRSSTRYWLSARKRCCSPSTPSSGRLLRGHLTGTVRARGAVPARRGRQARARRDGRPVPGTPRPPLFVLSLKAGGTGLTLTAANHVVHVDRWWNPAVEDQATDRAFRIGQQREPSRCESSSAPARSRRRSPR